MLQTIPRGNAPRDTALQMGLRRVVRRRSLLKLAGLGLALYALPGCASPTSPAAAPTQAPAQAPAASPKSEPAAKARTLRLSNTGQGLFEPPHPFMIRTGPAWARLSLIHDSLLWRDSTTQPIPWLAEKWSPSADGKEWTFTLRTGVNFQDGKPVSAEDVAFSYQYIAEKKPQFFSALADVFAGAQVVDAKTVKIVLKAPYAPFQRGIAAQVPVLPKHIWSAVSDPLKFSSKEAYIGCGAYRLGEMSETEKSFLFIAKEDFFLGRPYISRLEFTVVPDELVAMKAGKLDMSAPSVTEGFPEEVLASFRGDPKYAVVQGRGEGTTALHFNLAKGAPYDDMQFRRAIVYAINRQEMVDRLFGGNADPGNAGYLSLGNPFYSKDVEQYAYNPEQAKSLLDKAGYKLAGEQRRMPDGSPLSLTLLFPATSVRVAEFIRNQLALVGLPLELKSVDPGTANQLQTEGSYAVTLATYGGLGGDLDFLRTAFASPEQAKFWWKAWGYNSAEFKRIAGEQMREVDEAKRIQLGAQMQRILAEDVAIMPLYYPTRFIIYLPAAFDSWYFTPVWTPLPLNKHAFITGQKTGLTIRQ